MIAALGSGLHLGLHLDLAVMLTSFLLVFPVELPDKTFIASVVLATRYRPLPVWIGVTAAFLVQTAVAVTAGGLAALLPHRLVVAIAGLMFAIGAAVLLRGAAKARAEVDGEERQYRRTVTVPATGLRAAVTSFGVLFAAEWGDLSQLLTAGLVARFGQPLSVFVGAWLSLAAVAGLAVVVGKALVRYLSLAAIRRIGGGICLVLAAACVLELLGVHAPVG